MKSGLLAAAALLVLISLAHSILGERYVITRLFRRPDLPRLFGSDWFTRRTIRFAWHITSLAWLGFAAILFMLARDGTPSPAMLLKVIAVTFFLTSAVAGLASRGKHFAWPVFLAIAALVWLAA